VVRKQTEKTTALIKGMAMGVNSSLENQFYTVKADGMRGFVVSNRPGPKKRKRKTCGGDSYEWENGGEKEEEKKGRERKRNKKNK